MMLHETMLSLSVSTEVIYEGIVVVLDELQLLHFCKFIVVSGIT